MRVRFDSSAMRARRNRYAAASVASSPGTGTPLPSRLRTVTSTLPSTWAGVRTSAMLTPASSRSDSTKAGHAVEQHLHGRGEVGACDAHEVAAGSRAALGVTEVIVGTAITDLPSR